jgi:SAM-dependent MidA family methyltransferase
VLQTIAAWVLLNYQQLLRSPSNVALIELGPGRGTLLRQLLSSLHVMPGGDALLRAATVHLVEVSPELRQAQHDVLGCERAVLQSQVRTFAIGRVEGAPQTLRHGGRGVVTCMVQGRRADNA